MRRTPVPIQSRPCALAPVVLALLPAASAQLELADGFGQTTVHRETATPYGASNFGVAANGKVFIAIQDTVYRIDGNGRLTTMHALGANQTVGAMWCPPPGTSVLFTHFESSRLLTLDVASGRVTAQATLKNLFDLATAPDGSLLASANPNWPQPGAQNGIWVAGSSSPREIVKLTGPSGPIAFDRAGNLYYGKPSSTSPPPPGSVEVLRFDAAAIRRALAGGAPLTTRDATVTLRGLDAAHDFAFDDLGRLYISQPIRGGVLRTNRAVTALDPMPPVRRPSGFGLASTKLVFVDGGPGTFDAFQPSNGGTLFVLATDWTSGSSLVAVDATTPTMSLSPALPWSRGPVRFGASGLPKNALCVLWLAPGAPVPMRTLLPTRDGVPVWSQTPGPFQAVLPVPAMTDANGQVTWPANYGGGSPGTLTAEVMAVRLDRGQLALAGTAPAVRVDTR